MALTFRDLIALLKREDETTLLEILDISAEDIVDRFEDFIEDRYEQLEEKYAEELFDDDEEEEDGRGDWSSY